MEETAADPNAIGRILGILVLAIGAFIVLRLSKKKRKEKEMDDLE